MDKPNNILTQAEFKGLFDTYFQPIRGFIYYKLGDMKMAEDLAQDAFVKLWENRNGVKKETVKSYLYTIANNITINHLKRNQLRYKFENQVIHYTEKETPEFKLIQKEYEEKLNSVLAQIPDGSREVFLMNRLEGLKYREIAERLGLSVKAIEKRMSKAIQIIHEKLGVHL
ncbi:MAG: RNA polymerase sigma factor [Flavobacteriales bacterium]